MVKSRLSLGHPGPDPRASSPAFTCGILNIHYGLPIDFRLTEIISYVKVLRNN
jgi:hypothetical protein